MGENNTIKVQSLRKHSYKNWNFEYWSCNTCQQLDDCFTICQYKTGEPKNIEIVKILQYSLEAWLLRFETSMLSLDSKNNCIPNLKWAWDYTRLLSFTQGFVLVLGT